MFPFLARFSCSQRTEKALVGRQWLDVTNVMASKRSKKEKNDFRLASVAHERLCLSSIVIVSILHDINPLR